MLAHADQKSEPRRGGVAPLRRKRAPASAPPSPLKRKAIHLLLVFVTLVLVVDALVGEKGLMQTVRARRHYAELAASLDALERDNERMREETLRLRDDPAAIEALAREELGLMRQGEILFIVKPVVPPR
jgi:cell division protein FtsB